jgi:hypothetical protein
MECGRMKDGVIVEQAYNNMSSSSLSNFLLLLSLKQHCSILYKSQEDKIEKETILMIRMSPAHLLLSHVLFFYSTVGTYLLVVESQKRQMSKLDSALQELKENKVQHLALGCKRFLPHFILNKYIQGGKSEKEKILLKERSAYVKHLNPTLLSLHSISTVTCRLVVSFLLTEYR